MTTTIEVTANETQERKDFDSIEAAKDWAVRRPM